MKAVRNQHKGRPRNVRHMEGGNAVRFPIVRNPRRVQQTSARRMEEENVVYTPSALKQLEEEQIFVLLTAGASGARS